MNLEEEHSNDIMKMLHYLIFSKHYSPIDLPNHLHTL
jgi:hypothetical protein